MIDTINSLAHFYYVEAINNNPIDAAIIDDLIQTEYDLLISECKYTAKRHNEISEYSNELDKRFKAANKSIDSR